MTQPVIRFVPYRDLSLSDANFRNPRTDTGLSRAALLELAVSIVRDDLFYPLLVDGRGVIIGGQRRYRAIGLFLADPAAFEVATGMSGRDLVRRADDLREGVPVRYLGHKDPKAVAIADGLHRRDLSSYEVAAAFSQLLAEGSSRNEIARRVGKSRTYVSRHLKAFDLAAVTVTDAWRAGKVSLERVLELVDLPLEEQTAALARDLAAPRKRKKTGGHGRPGIEAVKRQLEELRGTLASMEAGNLAAPPGWDGMYARGFLDALRFVAGEDPDTDIISKNLEAIDG